MDAIFAFIDNFERTGYKDLPGAAVEAARKEVIDSLATALGGSSRPGVPDLAGLAEEWGGAGQSSVIGYGLRCPAPEAALVNGTMVHALDYDDGHPVAQVHIGCVAVPTCFAVAERQGGIGHKPYPNCGFTHPFIDAVLNLKMKYHIVPEQVQGIIARGGDPAYELTVPPEVKRAPRNPVDAQFSLPWAIAVALVNGRVSLKDFTAEAIMREELLDVSQKVTGELDTSMSRHGVGPGRVTVLMKNGTKYTEEVEHFPGSVARPMNFEDCAEKFRQCAAEFIKPLDRGKIEKVIGMVGGLENLADATEIIRMVG